jgi:hypothetical protein
MDVRAAPSHAPEVAEIAANAAAAPAALPPKIPTPSFCPLFLAVATLLSFCALALGLGLGLGLNKTTSGTGDHLHTTPSSSSPTSTTPSSSSSSLSFSFSGAVGVGVIKSARRRGLSTSSSSSSSSILTFSSSGVVASAMNTTSTGYTATGVFQDNGRIYMSFYPAITMYNASFLSYSCSLVLVVISTGNYTCVEMSTAVGTSTPYMDQITVGTMQFATAMQFASDGTVFYSGMTSENSLRLGPYVRSYNPTTRVKKDISRPTSTATNSLNSWLADSNSSLGVIWSGSVGIFSTPNYYMTTERCYLEYRACTTLLNHSARYIYQSPVGGTFLQITSQAIYRLVNSTVLIAWFGIPGVSPIYSVTPFTTLRQPTDLSTAIFPLSGYFIGSQPFESQTMITGGVTATANGLINFSYEAGALVEYYPVPQVLNSGDFSSIQIAEPVGSTSTKAVLAGLDKSGGCLVSLFDRASGTNGSHSTLLSSAVVCVTLITVSSSAELLLFTGVKSTTNLVGSVNLTSPFVVTFYDSSLSLSALTAL